MKYISSIDSITLYHWRKCLEGERKYCRIDINKGNKQEDENAWQILYDDYLSRFGIGKEHDRIIELKLEIAELECQYAESGQLFAINEINHLKRELEEIIKKPSEGSIDDCLTYLSLWVKFHIDQKKITVLEFYNYMEAYKKEAARLKELEIINNG